MKTKDYFQQEEIKARNTAIIIAVILSIVLLLATGVSVMPIIRGILIALYYSAIVCIFIVLVGHYFKFPKR